MKYQVLARKWRPKNFAELIGQEHVVTVLTNALAQQRLHHAYLFTGTRGVGKTTIARIFAKSLNCLQGVSANPCGKCDVCLEIDQGRFVDLLEIDAASRTKVDDTREILDNVQYAPTQGRYKVYLIDEVHMLSRSSFNALLKTLEEPPEHVKFILATTDPQKLPVTVLSRCLQFHLKALTVKQIEQKLVEILTAEKATFEQGAITLLAKAARGSMRDSLSLTDQAIAQGQGNIVIANVQQMLGGIDQHWPYKILVALIKQDSQTLMELSQEMASFSPSYSRLYAELIQLLHQIALYQITKQHFDLSPEHSDLLEKFSVAMSPEDVQLYYQIALTGRKDLPYAGDEQAAFDMTLLRMLAFKPIGHANELASQTAESSNEASAVNLDISKLNATNLADLDTSAIIEDVESKELLQQESVANKVDEVAIPPADLANTNASSQDSLTNEMLAIEQQAEQLAAQEPTSVEHTSPISPMTPSAIEPATNQIFEQQADQTITEADPTQDNQTLQQGETDSQKQVGLDADAAEVTSSLPTGLSSPVEAALATRNMLRSRKKQSEEAGKKPNDASQRQSIPAQIEKTTDSKTETVQNGELKTAENELPHITEIPEQPFAPEVIDPSVIKHANQVDRWANMVDAMALNGRLRQLAIHATIAPESNENALILCLNQSTKHLKSDNAHQQLTEFVSQYFNKPMSVELKIVEETVDDPYQIQGQINHKRYEYAKSVLLSDDLVQHFQQEFQAEVDESSIKAL